MKARVCALILFAVITLGVTGSVPAVDTYVVIINPNNPVSTLTKAQVSKFFLKKVTQWENGRPVVPVELAESFPVREVFSLEVHHREISSIKNYWKTMIFAGRAEPPQEKSSYADVMTYVKNNPDAIGYVAASVPLVGVKPVDVK